ncbi:MAG: nucleotidyltransferase substrate binding protein [Candidatus Margulisiibacteriota bacterium]
MNTSSLEKALTSLESAIQIYRQGLVPLGSPAEALLRDGILQRFEYTFELSWKTLKRYLEEYGIEQVDRFSNKQLFRVGFESGLLTSAEKWLDYLSRRNLTSHVYDEETAQKVYCIIEDFIVDVHYLLKQLTLRINA